ncbi:MAG: superinfection immunity protein [Dongiaceae bacterium]
MRMMNQSVDVLRRRPANAIAPRQSLAAAAFGFLIWALIMLSIAEFVAYQIIADNQHLQGQPWGYVLHYGIWMAFGGAPFYPALDELLSTNQKILPVALPVIAAAALTAYFLPSINAARRKSLRRFAVYFVNLLTGWTGFGWLVALVILRGNDQASPRTAPARPPRRTRTGRSILPASGPIATRSTRREGIKTVDRHEPAVAHRDSSRSWVRPR